MGANASALSHDGSSPGLAPAGKQCKCSAATLPAVHAGDSASSISGSHVEAEQAQQHQPSAGRSLLATLRERFQSSRVTAGLAPTAELQAAVLSAHAELTAGAKLKFAELYRMGHMLGTGHYARWVARLCHVNWAALGREDGWVYVIVWWWWWRGRGSRAGMLLVPVETRFSVLCDQQKAAAASLCQPRPCTQTGCCVLMYGY